MIYWFFYFVFIAVFSHCVASEDISFFEDTALSILIKEKQLMPHLNNVMAQKCMYVCKSWCEYIKAYRDCRVKDFEKAYPRANKINIVCTQEDGTRVNIFADSVIIDASGNGARGLCSDTGAQYLFEHDSHKIYKKYRSRSFSEIMHVSDAITNLVRTVYIAKSERNTSTGHEEVAYGVMYCHLYKDFEKSARPRSIFLKCPYDVTISYDVVELIDKQFVLDNGMPVDSTDCNYLFSEIFQSDGTRVRTMKYGKRIGLSIYQECDKLLAKENSSKGLTTHVMQSMVQKTVAEILFFKLKNLFG